jgi:hypothetical protein
VRARARTHTHTHTDLRGYTFCNNTIFSIHIWRPFKNQKPTTMHMDVFRCTTTISLPDIHVLRLSQNSVFCLCAISWCTHKNILKLISRELPEFIPNPWRGSNICTSHTGNRQLRKYKQEYKAVNKLESSVETVTCYSDKTQCRKHQLLLYFNNARNWPLVNFKVGNMFTPLKWTWRGNIICYWTMFGNVKPFTAWLRNFAYSTTQM